MWPEYLIQDFGYRPRFLFRHKIPPLYFYNNKGSLKQQFIYSGYNWWIQSLNVRKVSQVNNTFELWNFLDQKKNWLLFVIENVGMLVTNHSLGVKLPIVALHLLFQVFIVVQIPTASQIPQKATKSLYGVEGKSEKWGRIQVWRKQLKLKVH